MSNEDVPQLLFRNNVKGHLQIVVMYEHNFLYAHYKQN